MIKLGSVRGRTRDENDANEVKSRVTEYVGQGSPLELAGLSALYPTNSLLDPATSSCIGQGAKPPAPQIWAWWYLG